MNTRLLRGLAGATTLALLATAMLSAPAMGANAREVFFGSPGEFGGGYANGNLLFGDLSNTTVTTGGKSKIDVLIRNDDGQALNHVRIAGGDETTGLAFNPAFAKPSGTSLGDASIAFFDLTDGPAGASCSWDSSGFLCDIGSLAADDFASFTIVLNAPATFGAHPYWFTASWNEGWSSTGTNADYNFAVDDLDVVEASCTNGTASWFLATEQVNLGDGGATCFNQDATITSGRNGNVDLGGNGGFASVAIDDGFLASCPAPFKCFGNTISVSILSGATVPGGVVWSGTWMGTKTIKGVIHFGDTPGDVTPIAFTKQNKCSASKLTDCWVSLTTTSRPASVTAVWVTGSNGKGGGFT